MHNISSSEYIDEYLLHWGKAMRDNYGFY